MGVRPVARRPGFRGWLRDVEDHFFPPAGKSSNPRGVLSASLPEWPAAAVALLIGAAAAWLIESAMKANPVPAGGDPGQWLSTSYAYVGLPYPSWIIPGQYPPLLFPLLGGLVRLMGSPMAGARAYVAVAAVLVGLSTYFLARGLTRRRSTALVAEAIVMLNPTLLSMFFWGYYPNLLGFVFLNLSLGFLVRFIRSRRDLHLYMFWVCCAATVLTHSLVAVVLAGSCGLFVLGTILFRVLPRETYRTPAGWAGIATFSGSVGGFYAATAALKVPHPDYLQSGAFAYVRNTTPQIFNLVTHPFFPAVTISTDDSILLLWALGLGTLLVALLARYVIKRSLSLGTMATMSLAAAPLLIAAAGWELAVVTDYSRFAYFLVLPIGLGLALLLDRVLTAIGWTLPPRSSTVRAEIPRRLRAWRADQSRGAVSPGAIVLAVVVVGLLGSAEFVASAQLPQDEQITTTQGHDQAFLQAIQLIRSSGTPGAILTDPGVAKWTRALLDRNAYFPNLAARYTFDPSHLVDEEETYFALTSRYVATNGAVAVAALGTNLSDGNATFQYEPAFFGSFEPVLALPASDITALVSRNGSAVPENVTVNAVPTLAPVGPSSFTLSYPNPTFLLNVTVSVPGTGPFATMAVTAVATPGYHLWSLSGSLTGSGRITARNVSDSGTFSIQPYGYGGALVTTASVLPAEALRSVSSGGRNSGGSTASFRIAPPGGASARSLSVTLDFSTPKAATFLPGLPPLVTADQTFSDWWVRFVLFASGHGAPDQVIENLQPGELGFLHSEYGAKVLGRSGPWLVVLLPPPPDLPGSPNPPAG